MNPTPISPQSPKPRKPETPSPQNSSQDTRCDRPQRLNARPAAHESLPVSQQCQTAGDKTAGDPAAPICRPRAEEGAYTLPPRACQTLCWRIESCDPQRAPPPYRHEGPRNPVAPLYPGRRITWDQPSRHGRKCASLSDFRLTSRISAGILEPPDQRRPADLHDRIKRFSQQSKINT